MIASVYAVGCLLATGCLDLIFKFYSNIGNSRGLMLTGVGAIWAILQGIYTFNSPGGLVLDSATVLYGSLAAVAVVLSNVLLLECMARLPVSIASTIYRLNTIPLLLMAIYFLGEDPGAQRFIGVFLGLLGVCLLYSNEPFIEQSSEQSALNFQQSPERTRTDKASVEKIADANSAVGTKAGGNAVAPVVGHVFTFWFLLIVAASCIRALYGILSKAGLSQGADANSMMLIAALGWFTGGLIYLLFDKNRIFPTRGGWLIGAAGVLVFAIVWLLTNALALGDAVAVMPIANMGFVAAFIFAVMFGLESMTRRKLGAVVTALVSVVLISTAR